MAARKTARKSRTAAGRATRKKKTARGVRGRARTAISRLEDELPRSLGEVRTRIRRSLNQLESEVERTRALYRRRTARLLREASHRLGRLEAQGERGWRDLNTRARREVASLLRRLESAVAPPPTRKRVRRKKA
jgi:hypothetical protein